MSIYHLLFDIIHGLTLKFSMEKNKTEIFLAGALSFFPAYLLYLAVYSLTHDSVITPSMFMKISTTTTLTGGELKLWGLLYLLGFLSLIYYAAFPKDSTCRKYLFHPKGLTLLSKTRITIWIIWSLIYLAIILYFAENLNPW